MTNFNMYQFTDKTEPTAHSSLPTLSPADESNSSQVIISQLMRQIQQQNQHIRQLQDQQQMLKDQMRVLQQHMERMAQSQRGQARYE